MKQLLAFNSQQLPTNTAKILPKPIPLLSHEQSAKRDQRINIFKSKKCMKRSQQILEIVSRKGSKQLLDMKHVPKGKLKNFIVGHLNRINLNIVPMTMKLLQKPDAECLKGKQRCTTQSNEEQSMLFTFYPKPKHSQAQTNDTSLSQETASKRMQVRSYSLKNSPIVDYPLNNKILPKVFRVRTEVQSGQFRQSGDITNVQNNAKTLQQKADQSLPLKQSNNQRKRVFSIRSRNKLDCSFSMEKLHRPILQALANKRHCQEEQILLQ